MKRLIFVGILALGACTNQNPKLTIEDSKYSSPYMNAKNTELFEIHNGAKVTKETKDYWELTAHSSERASYDKDIIFEVTDGVWTFGSESIVNLHAVKGPEGLIIYDTGDNSKDGENFYKHLRKVTDEPIKAIIYSHSHYTLGARVIVDEEAKRGNTDILIIGHPKVNDEMLTTGGLSALYPEISGVLMARSVEQFNMFMPEEGPDSPFKNTIIPGEASGYVPVNTPVSHMQEMKVAGLNLVFYTEDIATDTDNQVMVWFPDEKIVMNNVLWGWYPNIYSIRGGKFRDPVSWVKAIEIIQDLDPDYLLNSHSTSLDDKAEIQERLQAYKDGLSFMLDQTLKGIMLGLNPDELQYFIELPKHLEVSPILIQNYGELSTMPGRIYTATFGQFDRNAVNISKLHPSEEATRMVDAMGGEKATYKKAQSAFNDGDYLWAAQLSDYLIGANPSEKNKQLKANCLREMGYRTMATNSRSWLISQALELEGKTHIPVAIPAAPASIQTNLYDYFYYYRIRINAKEAATTNQAVSVDFGDGKKYGMHIRKGVVYTYENIADMDEQANLEIKMLPETWALVYNNISSTSELIENGSIEVTKGTKASAKSLFELFDVVFDWENDPALQMIQNML